MLCRIAAGQDLAHGQGGGIYFTGTGHHTWREVSERVARAGKELGYLDTNEVREVSLQVAAHEVTGNSNTQWTELGFALRSRTLAPLSRGIGWEPRRTREYFERSFVQEWRELIPGLKKNTV